MQHHPENEDDEGCDDNTMAIYNFAKIITLYIYKKFFIDKIKNHKNEIIKDFEDTKKILYDKIFYLLILYFF